MKIAVVGPSPVPFTIGGCENLLWGLCDAINQETQHQAELIKLPLKERCFWDLIDSYHIFYELDLSHFDLIISTKYPSWMVRHSNSICYMVHELRGLYDTYQSKNLPYEVKPGNKYIDNLLGYMDRHPCPYSLDYFFEMLYELKDKREISEEYFRFPGPFIRRVVHYMDHWGLAQEGTRRYYSISKTVKNRKEYYPEGCEVTPVYPPTTLKTYGSREYKYIFMISRLDAPKRIFMLIEAMKYVKSDIELLIAGTGSERENLEKLAENDKRIKFLGFVRDDEVEAYYADSLVIPYFPYDEDYGLITIEAFLHKKPVITTKDAGGPTEFVEDGETGYVVDFNAKEIASKIDYFAENPSEAKRMGENGYEKVRDITWNSVISQLLAFTEEEAEQKGNLRQRIHKRKKLVVPVSFPVYPPQTGGQARVYNLYKQLAKEYDIEIISFANPDAPPVNGYIADGMIENRVKKTDAHFRAESQLREKTGVSIGDIALFTMSELTPAFGEQFVKAQENADAVVICHPYCYPAVKPFLEGKPIIYEAHNVEYILKQGILPDSETGRKMLQAVYNVEKECCDKSVLITVCSREDAENFNKIYGVPMEKMLVIPNGVDCERTTFTDCIQRKENKKKLGLENETLALFMGSFHKPNLEACDEILNMAEQCPNIKFLLMGSQCYNYKGKKIPPNVGLLGIVSDEVKNRVFATVDFALNPMMSGTGTNLKMFDYMSAGIPIITTRFGTRGIENKEVFILAEIQEMIGQIKNFDIKNAEEKVLAARKYTEQVFDWSVAVTPMTDTVKQFI